MEISRVITISTGHVTKKTATHLDNAAEHFCPFYPVIYRKGDYGWIIHVSDEDFEEDYNISDDLRKCMELAFQNKCDWLCLDRDGEVLDELPLYNW